MNNADNSTPRTDAATKNAGSESVTEDRHAYWVLCRQLERELNEAKAERDEARQWLAERPSTELYDRAVARNEELCSKLTTAESELAELRKDRDGWKDCAEYGWTIIANAGGGDWNKESKDWQEAAVRFRTQYYACLDAARQSSKATHQQGEGL